jgi:predicted amidophosphoribosyltransferase
MRCGRCALSHDAASECPEPVEWESGDALWDYHGGRPAFGALLVPGIKAGEGGWRRALLARAVRAALPNWAGDCDAVVAVPTLRLKRVLRGFDLAYEWASESARILGLPRIDALAKHWRSPSQTGRPESRRRTLPKRAFRLRSAAGLAGMTVLLMDDVWTTGTTLVRCAKILREGGAAEVRVLTLFRAL